MSQETLLSLILGPTGVAVVLVVVVVVLSRVVVILYRENKELRDARLEDARTTEMIAKAMLSLQGERKL